MFKKKKDPLEEAKEYLIPLGEIFKHECLLSKKKESCHQLAEYYLTVDRNVGKAKEIWKMACEELGSRESCLALGNLHLTNEEVKDPVEAMRLFGMACDKGQHGACNNAGFVYEYRAQGKGGTDSPIKQDITKAMHFYEKGCNGKDKNACFNLSSFYIMAKHGIEKDFKKALELSLKCCDLGHPHCCANVSRMYKLGDGVEKDPKLAAKYRNLARKHSFHDLKIN